MQSGNEKFAGMAIVSFTPQGKALAGKIADCLKEPVGDARFQVSCVHKPESLKDWCREGFLDKQALLFIGSLGIAVRTIAPFLQGKTKDPAVLAADEKGEYFISVLSGHLGGANELAAVLAERLGGRPVITTASDVNGKIAIDVFAKKNNLMIESMEQAKAAAVNLIAGKRVGLLCDGRINGAIPEELSYQGKDMDFWIEISPYKRKGGANALHLIPKAFILGIGCRKGKTLTEIEDRVLKELEEKQISVHSLKAVATIDLKKEEQGLLKFCDKYRLPVTFYSKEQLKNVPGEYQASEFVREITGTDNVCERAAVLKLQEEVGYTGRTSGELSDSLVIKKSGKEGITIALARTDWSVAFE